MLDPAERRAFGEAIERLRDLGAPDEVIAQTVADVAAEAHRRRQTANPGVFVIGGIAIAALVAASLEAQRRRGVQRGAGEALTSRLEEWSKRFRGLANQQVDEEDDEEDARSSNRRAEARTGSAEEPPPDLEPLIQLTTQILADEIIKKGLEDNPAFLETVDRYAREVVPKLRELYPEGLDETELRRVLELGQEQDRKTFRSDEVITAVLLERLLGRQLHRAPHKGDDWIDRRTSTTYDGVLGNMPKELYTFDDAKRSIDEHARKVTDVIVVDLHQLSEDQASEIKEYINTDLPTDIFKRIIILE